MTADSIPLKAPYHLSFPLVGASVERKVAALAIIDTTLTPAYNLATLHEQMGEWYAAQVTSAPRPLHTYTCECPTIH